MDAAQRQPQLARLLVHAAGGGFLILFLAYPLGLGVWLSMTDARIGRAGVFIGLENFIWLWDDPVFWLVGLQHASSTRSSPASLSSSSASVWRLLLNHHLPFKAFLRAIVLLPFIIPTVLSAIAFWWIYDAQFSIISWTLTHSG